MTALRFVLTNAGRAAMIDAGAGGTAPIVIAKAGVTASVVVAAPTLEVLPGEIKRIDAVAGLAVSSDTLHLTIRDSSTDAYTVRGVGLYLADGTLFAVYAQPDPIVQKADVTAFFIAADMVFEDGDAELIEFGDTNFLNPPATETVQGIAYLATIAEALAGAVADKIMTPAAMAAVLANYVAAEQLGQPNGVATLGPDGKLLVAQRPPIDLIDVWAVANQAAMLALVATVGDFAVRADNGLVYVLQSLPATTLANWLEISTPSPVSSVNGHVGVIVLTAADVGAVPTARTINGGGLVTGGGSLAADRALSVAIASAAEIVAGTANDKAITPAGLGGLPRSLTPNGFMVLPNGIIINWIQYRAPFTADAAVSLSYPMAFTEQYLIGAATAWLATANNFRDLFAQLVSPGLGSCIVQMQASTSNDKRADGFDLLLIGK